jgi:hypothetical protein
MKFGGLLLSKNLSSKIRGLFVIEPMGLGIYCALGLIGPVSV